jgi:putative copper export protein
VTDFIDLWLHVLSLATYFGTTVAVVLMILPLARAEPDPAARRRLLARTLRVYNPLVIAALGVLLMTGAFNLTSYKAALRGVFFSELGHLLMWKLGLSFALIMLATYSVFGLGHRLVRAEQWQEPVEAEKEAGIMRRLMGTLIVALLLTAVIAVLGLRLAHTNLTPPQPPAATHTAARLEGS